MPGTSSASFQGPLRSEVSGEVSDVKVQPWYFYERSAASPHQSSRGVLRSQVFPDVTILFSDVVKFNEICIHITPMQVVDMLNEIYIVFDTLSEKHNVYKVGRRRGAGASRAQPRLTLRCAQVETIRDAYMVVAGVPNKTTFHAHHICDMALDMLSSIDHLKDPSTGDNIQIRVGEDARGRSRGRPRRAVSSGKPRLETG